MGTTPRGSSSRRQSASPVFVFLPSSFRSLWSANAKHFAETVVMTTLAKPLMFFASRRHVGQTTLAVSRFLPSLYPSDDPSHQVLNPVLRISTPTDARLGTCPPEKPANQRPLLNGIEENQPSPMQPTQPEPLRDVAMFRRAGRSHPFCLRFRHRPILWAGAVFQIRQAPLS